MAAAGKYELRGTYGKQSVPVFKVTKTGPRHAIHDLTVQILLEGDVLGSWTVGDNSGILPTETQKNTCYAVALETDFASAEEYIHALGADILGRHTHLEQVSIWCTERVWRRVVVDGVEHDHAFVRPVEPEKRTAMLRLSRRGGVEHLASGICDMVLMKTTQSGFKGFIVDKYTNLQPVGEGTALPDRILCTELSAFWEYGDAAKGALAKKGGAAFDFVRSNDDVAAMLLKQFAGPPVGGRFSPSLQETAYRMGVAVLDLAPAVDAVEIATPNVHFYRSPLEDFGLPNPNKVFQATDPQSTASGRIVTRLCRGEEHARGDHAGRDFGMAHASAKL